MFDPTAASTSVDSAVSTLAAAGLMSYFLEWLKNTKLVPFIDASKTTLLRLCNGALAVAAALSIHYTFDSDAGTLVVTGLSVSGIIHGLWEVGKQWAFQQMAYDGIVSKKNGAA